MKFSTTIKELLNGKRTRREDWEEDSYLYLDEYGDLRDSYDDIHYLDKAQMEADDWEIYRVSIYLVYNQDEHSDNREIIGIFKSKENAEKFAKENNGFVEENGIDD